MNTPHLSWRSIHGYDCVPQSPVRHRAKALRYALLPTGQMENTRSALFRALLLDREWQRP